MAENLVFITVFIILFTFFGFLYSKFRLHQYRKTKKENSLKWKSYDGQWVWTILKLIGI